MKTYSGIDKAKFVAEVRKHREQDSLMQGTYGEQNGQWRGCAVACSLRSLDILDGRGVRDSYDAHSEFESRGLWPEWLARLEDQIFEGLPKADAMLWPEQLAESVPVGKDITPVLWKFIVWLMTQNIDRVESLDISDKLKKQVIDAIDAVRNVYVNAVEAGAIDRESAAGAAARAAWSAARAAESAESAAESAESAAWSAARAAESAESAAESAESAAESAARAAARAARSAAWSAAYKEQAAELLRLLRAEGNDEHNG